MPAERLRAQDAALWCVQAPDAPLQIGALCLFEAGPLQDETGTLRIDDLRRHIAHRFGYHPRTRTRLASMPFDQGLVWVDDTSFDIANHVRATALPHPGGDAELRECVSRLLEVRLDPRRPLWEIWVVEGVAGDRVAVVTKVSHAMADGMAVLELALSALDIEAGCVVPDAPPDWSPEPPPDARSLLVREMIERGRLQLDLLRGLVRSLRRPDRLVARIAQIGSAGAESASLAPSLPITGPVGAHRDFAWVRLPIEGLLDVKRACEVTLNDVVLTVVTGALRHYLEHAGASLDVRPRVLIPVSTHAVVGEEIENRFSMMLTYLPIGVADPVECLHEVHEEMDRHKASSQAAIGPMLFALGGILPPALLRLVGPTLLEHQPFVNLAVTNIPGTREPLYLLGSRMLEVFPFVGGTGNLALIIGVLSYEDGLGVGITVDPDVVPDLDVLVEGVGQAARALIEAGRGGERIG